MYGVFALISVVGNLNMLTNLGLSNTLILLLSKQGRCQESNIDILVNLTTVSMISVGVVCLAILFEVSILNLLGVPNLYLSDTILLYRCLIISNLLLIVGQSFTAIIDSQQRIVITNILQFSYSILYWGGMIVVVSMGFGLGSIGKVALLAASCWFLSVVVYVTLFWGTFFTQLSLGAALLSFRKQISIGAKLYTSSLLSLLFEPLTKILISNYLGLSAVAYFDIGLRVRNQVASIFQKALYPLFPYIAALKESDQLKRQVSKGTLLLFFAMVVTSLLLFYVSPPFIELWLGDQYDYMFGASVQTYTIGLLIFSIPMIPPYYYIMTKGYTSYIIYIHAFSMVVNIVFFFAAISLFGPYTAMISVTASYIASFGLIVYIIEKNIGGFDRVDVTHLGKAILVILIAVVIAEVMNHITDNRWIGALVNFVVILLSAALGMFLLKPIVLHFKFIELINYPTVLSKIVIRIKHVIK